MPTRNDVKRRRTHKKSKTGCSECKRRHVRCDEKRPCCSNCQAARLTCPFQAEDTAGSSNRISVPLAISPRNSENGSPQGETEVNMMHLQLYHNFLNETCTAFARTQGLLDVYRRNIVQCAFEYPFLMHEILAVSALHLSFNSREQSQLLRHTATCLQSRALQGLNTTLTRVGQENCLPLLFFSHTMGIHSFCDTFTSRDDGFGSFLDRLIHSINLLRGINAVIRPWWQYLTQTDMGKLILDAHERRTRPLTPGGETNKLRDLVKLGEVSEVRQRVYEEVIDRLQMDFDEWEGPVDEPVDTTSTVFSWLVTSSSGYVELLDERRPEALIILAYYAVILHKRRKSWAIRDAGVFVFESITSYLGPRWDRWLEWPRAEINGTKSYMDFQPY